MPGLFGLLVECSEGGINAFAILHGYVATLVIIVVEVGVSPLGMAWAGCSLLLHVMVDNQPG